MIHEKTCGEIVDLFHPDYWSFWHVERDHLASPFVPSLRGPTEPDDLFGIFRTYRGVGKIVTKSKTYYLNKGSLIILKISDILTYNPPKDNEWEYVCVNYTSPKHIPYFSHNTIYEIPFFEDEKGTIKAILDISNKTVSIYKVLTRLRVTELIFMWAESHLNKQVEVLPHAEEVENCLIYINENLESPLRTAELAKKYRLSESSFYRAFLAVVGLSPKSYIVQQRLTKAAFLLKNTAKTVQAVSYEVGYYSEFQFSRDFKKRYGTSPSFYRKNPL